MTNLDFARFRVLSFDCYGTLIDWERGLLAAFGEVLESRALAVPDETLLELFATAESEVEADAAGSDFMTYRAILEEVLDRIGDELGFAPSPAECEDFAASVSDWPAFGDSAAALAQLATRFDLIVLSNVDADLFEGSNAKLGRPFAKVFTADEIGSYKPNQANFEHLIANAGVPKDQILHVAQSLFHDIGPAQAAGLQTVWVNRRGVQSGSGATPLVEVEPGLEVSSLEELAGILQKAN